MRKAVFQPWMAEQSSDIIRNQRLHLTDRQICSSALPWLNASKAFDPFFKISELMKSSTTSSSNMSILIFRVIRRIIKKPQSQNSLVMGYLVRHFVLFKLHWFFSAVERGGLVYRCAGGSTWSDERCGEQVVAINFNDALCKCVTAVPDPINSFNGKPHTQSGAG